MLLQDLMRARPQLSEAERAIADYVLVQRDRIARVSARQIAREVYTAPSTVVRFCQKFGFGGYDDFREAFLAELHYLTSHFTKVDSNYPFSFGERRGVTARKIGALYREVVDDTLDLIPEEALDQAVKIIDAADEVCFFSAGVQAALAEGFEDEMLKIGRNVTIVRRANTVFYRAAHAEPGRVAFILASYSGETDQLVRVARKVRERGIPLIAITSFGGNTLSTLADVVLPVSSREHLERNLGQFSMNVSTMLVLVALYACVFNENYYVNFESRVALRHEFEAFRDSQNPLLTGDGDDAPAAAEPGDQASPAAPHDGGDTASA